MSSVLCFTRLQCLMLLCFSKTSMSSAFMLFKDFNVFYFTRLQCLLLLWFLKSSMSSILCFTMSISSAFMPYRTPMPSILCFIGLQGPLFGVIGLQCPFVSFNFFFYFLWRPVLNSQIARMKLVSLSLLIFYFQ